MRMADVELPGSRNCGILAVDGGRAVSAAFLLVALGGGGLGASRSSWSTRRSERKAVRLVAIGTQLDSR